MNARTGAAVGAGGSSSPRRKAAWAASLLVGAPSTGVTSNDANGWVGRCGQGSIAGETGWRGGAAARSEASGWVTWCANVGSTPRTLAWPRPRGAVARAVWSSVRSCSYPVKEDDGECRTCSDDRPGATAPSGVVEGGEGGRTGAMGGSAPLSARGRS